MQGHPNIFLNNNYEEIIIIIISDGGFVQFLCNHKVFNQIHQPK